MECVILFLLFVKFKNYSCIFLFVDGIIKVVIGEKFMRQRKGFTLIELLAVIVILAVIALIATPLVLNIIERAEKGAFRDSVYGLMEATEFQVILDDLKYPITFVYPEDAALIHFKGTKPSEGYIQIVAEGKVKLALGNGRWCAVKDINDSQVTVKNGKCDKVDLKKPIISGYGDLNQEIAAGTTYQLPNVTATDADGNSLDVITTIKKGTVEVDSIDTSLKGNYTITYTAQDKNGNVSVVTVTLTITKEPTDTDKIVEDIKDPETFVCIEDNTYCYYRGENPDNWVKFNNEDWRILGIQDGKLKLLNMNLTMKGYAWDTSNNNDWARPASLNTYLNSEYYKKLEPVQDKIVASEYYIGILPYNSEMTIKEVRPIEKTKTWTGKVGLMSASDFLLASLDTECSIDTKAVWNTNCMRKNWIWKSWDEWVITASSSTTPDVWVISTGGGISGQYMQYNHASYAPDRAVRPVIFLSPDVTIEGNGTQDKPYIIQ